MTLNDQKTELIFLGAGDGVGEIMNIVEACIDAGAKFEVIGALDDDERLHNTKQYNISVLGGLNKVVDFPDVKFIFAIGSEKTYLRRLDIVDKLDLSPDRFQTLIHPKANIFKTAQIGAGSIVHFGTTISQNVKVNPLCLITVNVTIGSSAIIGSGVILSSQAFVGGHAKLGTGCFVGACSSIADGVEVGPGAKVGMASAVLKPVAAGIFVLGNPARNVIRSPVPDLLIELWDKEKTEPSPDYS